MQLILPRLIAMDHPSVSEKRIFIQIASYRDPQLGPTIRDLIEQAAHPEQLRIGVCLQVNPNDEQTCGLPSLPGPQERQGAELCCDLVSATASEGVCWARSRTQALWQGEPFTLQIDSHMRFARNWDQQLLASWNRCNDPRAVLSCYPNGFQPPAVCDTAMLPVLAAHRFDQHGILRLQGIKRFKNPDALPEHPLPCAFIAAGMLFGPGSIIEAVLYDPQLYFYGEEISIALRLWTHGFNFYNPDRLLIFHLYKHSGEKNVTHWSDHTDWSQRNRTSIARIRALLKGEASADPFGFGSARSLTTWQEWSGIDLQEQTISATALKGNFTAAPPATAAAAAG